MVVRFDDMMLTPSVYSRLRIGVRLATWNLPRNRRGKFECVLFNAYAYSASISFSIFFNDSGF